MILLIFLVFVFPKNNKAQGISFYAIASSGTIKVGDKIEIAYTVENAEFSKLTTPNWGANLKFLYGPSTISSYEVINGKMSSKKTFSYLLKAVKPGKIKLLGATATINGKSYKSNDLIINIVEKDEVVNNSGPTQKPSNSGVNSDDNEERQSIEDQVNTNIFVKGFVDKNTVFEGQQVVLVFKVFYLIQVNDLQIAKNPSFKNFFSYEMELDKNYQGPHEEKYNGKLYNCQTFMKTALFPIKPGDYVIDPVELSCEIPIMIGPRGFKIQDSKQINIKSDPIPIHVKPLGNGIKPDDFCGGIGKFSFLASFDKDVVKAGEPLTYSIKVRGKGNIKLLNLPKPAFPGDFEVYNPKIKEEINTQTGDVVGMKNFDYLILPQKAGKYTIPSYSISYFDEEKQDFNRIVFPESTIQVIGNVEEDISTSARNKNGDSEKDKPLNGIEKLFSNKKTGRATFFGSVGFYIAMVLPVLLLLAFFVKNRKNENFNKSENGNKINDYKELLDAKKHLDNQALKPFYKAIQDSLLGFLTAKTGVSFFVMNKDKMDNVLAEHQVKADDREKVLSILNQCDQALFSPISENSRMNGIYVETLNLMEQIDLQIKLPENE